MTTWFLSCFLACHPQPEDEARDPQKPYFLLAEKYVTDRIRNLAPSLALQMEAHIWFKLLRAQSTWIDQNTRENKWKLGVRNCNWLQLFKRWIGLSTGIITIHWITQLVLLVFIHWIVIYPVDSPIHRLNNWGLGPVSRKSRKLFGSVEPFVELRPAYSIKLVFSYVVKGIEIKITAKFRASRRLRFEDTKRIMSPEMCPKRFGTFEKRATGQ